MTIVRCCVSMGCHVIDAVPRQWLILLGARKNNLSPKRHRRRNSKQNDQDCAQKPHQYQTSPFNGTAQCRTQILTLKFHKHSFRLPRSTVHAYPGRPRGCRYADALAESAGAVRGSYGWRSQGAGTRCLTKMSTKNNRHSSITKNQASMPPSNHTRVCTTLTQKKSYS